MLLKSILVLSTCLSTTALFASAFTLPNPCAPERQTAASATQQAQPQTYTVLGKATQIAGVITANVRTLSGTQIDNAILTVDDTAVYVACGALQTSATAPDIHAWIAGIKKSVSKQTVQNKYTVLTINGVPSTVVQPITIEGRTITQNATCTFAVTTESYESSEVTATIHPINETYTYNLPHTVLRSQIIASPNAYFLIRNGRHYDQYREEVVLKPYVADVVGLSQEVTISLPLVGVREDTVKHRIIENAQHAIDALDDGLYRIHYQHPQDCYYLYAKADSATAKPTVSLMRSVASRVEQMVTTNDHSAPSESLRSTTYNLSQFYETDIVVEQKKAPTLVNKTALAEGIYLYNPSTQQWTQQGTDDPCVVHAFDFTRVVVPHQRPYYYVGMDLHHNKAIPVSALTYVFGATAFAMPDTTDLLAKISTQPIDLNAGVLDLSQIPLRAKLNNTTTQIIFRGVNVTDEFANKICALTGLTHLSFVSQKTTYKSCQITSSKLISLIKMPTLQSIDTTGTHIGDAVITEIINRLKSSQSFTVKGINKYDLCIAAIARNEFTLRNVQLTELGLGLTHQTIFNKAKQIYTSQKNDTDLDRAEGGFKIAYALASKMNKPEYAYYQLLTKVKRSFKYGIASFGKLVLTDIDAAIQTNPLAPILHPLQKLKVDTISTVLNNIKRSEKPTEWADYEALYDAAVCAITDNDEYDPEIRGRIANSYGVYLSFNNQTADRQYFFEIATDCGNQAGTSNYAYSIYESNPSKAYELIKDLPLTAHWSNVIMATFLFSGQVVGCPKDLHKARTHALTGVNATNKGLKEKSREIMKKINRKDKTIVPDREVKDY